MCDFFSCITLGDGNPLYFDLDQRKKNWRKHSHDFSDSHSHIAHHYKVDIDRCNRYEYNPDDDDLERDRIVLNDDSEKVLSALRAIPQRQYNLMHRFSEYGYGVPKWLHRLKVLVLRILGRIQACTLDIKRYFMKRRYAHHLYRFRTEKELRQRYGEHWKNHVGLRWESNPAEQLIISDALTRVADIDVRDGQAYIYHGYPGYREWIHVGMLAKPTKAELAAFVKPEGAAF